MRDLEAGRERETEIEVKDEMQRWIVGGREGRRKLKMRERRKWDGRKIERDREQKEERGDKKTDKWYNQKHLVMQSNQKNSLFSV